MVEERSVIKIMPRIATFAETDRGGAGLSALKLNLALREMGLDARLYVNRKASGEPSVYELPTKPGRFGSEFRVGQYKCKDNDLPMTTGLSVKYVSHLEAIWEWSDCILLRWVSTVLPDWLIGFWSAKNKPVVWCLSDMAPLTGGCHYSMGCDQYELGCSGCEMAPSHLQFLPREVYKRRKRLWRNLTIVSPSRWLEDVASNSGITKGKDIRLIRTGVELDVFRPEAASSSTRRSLNLDGKKVIFFGAGSLSDPRKGGKYLAPIVNALNDRMGLRGKYIVVAPGYNPSVIKDLNCESRALGHIDDRAELAAVKASSDLTLLPYVEDNLPNVALESLACGTPVCAFAVGGLKDVIEDDVNGYLAKPFDVWDLSSKVAKALADPLDSCKVRAWAEANLDVRQQAERYVSLFEELLSKKELGENGLRGPEAQKGGMPYAAHG